MQIFLPKNIFLHNQKKLSVLDKPFFDIFSAFLNKKIKKLHT